MNATSPRSLSSLTTPQAAWIELHRRGYWPIVIYPPGVPLKPPRGTSTGKEPIGFKWGLERWTYDRARDTFLSWPKAGCGVCLGPGRAPGGGWLADVEGDGPKAEESRLKLFGGEAIETTGWGSARGGHQLIECDGGRLKTIAGRLKPYQVKGANKSGVFKIPALPDLELRLGGYKPDGIVKQLQSVTPPTCGTDGRSRVWNGVENLVAAPETFYAVLESIAAEVEGKAQSKRAGAPRSNGTPRTGTDDTWSMPRSTRAGDWLRGALVNAVARIKATAPGSRRHIYRDEAYNLAGYLDFNVGYTEHELAQTLKSALAIGVSFGDPVVETTVNDAIAAGKAAPQSLPSKLFEEDDAEQWRLTHFAALVAAATTTEPDSGSTGELASEVIHTDQVEQKLPTELTPIAQSMVQDLDNKRIALHTAGTAAGKTFGVAQTVVDRCRRGLATLIALPTLRLVNEMMKLLYRLDSAAFHPDADAVAIIGGYRSVSAIDGETDADADDDDEGEYPIRHWIKIIIGTHEQRLRKGESRFIRAIWSKLERDDHEDHPRPPFALIIDEVGDFVRSIRCEAAPAHRTKRKGEPDGSGGTLLPLVDCPMSGRSGNCANCELQKYGGEHRFNKYGIRERVPPRQIDVSASGERLRVCEPTVFLRLHGLRGFGP